jgi:tRNA (guanine-N7-)-methyltransferase
MTAPRPDLDVSPYTLPYPSAPLDWAAVFGEPAPAEIDLEIGPGKGLFLANTAPRWPGRGYVGVEAAHKYARAAAERIAKADLPNVRIVTGDAKRFLHEFVPPGSLHAIHVYFPDPWWKQRHRKRRMISEPFLDDATRALAPGGELHLATDVEEYFGVMQTLLTARPHFTRLPDPQVAGEPQHDLDYLTNFERKYRLQGRPIYRASYLTPTTLLPLLQDHLPDTLKSEPEEG